MVCGNAPGEDLSSLHNSRAFLFLKRGITMTKLTKSKTGKMYLNGKNGEWIDEVVNRCEESGIDIPIIKSWFKKAPTIGKYLTFPIALLKMAEEIMDNNRSFFKSIGDVFRAALYIGMLVIYRMITMHKDKSFSSSWGEANYLELVHMQEMVSDMQECEGRVRLMKNYWENVEQNYMSIEKFREACNGIIEKAPEDKKIILRIAYEKILNKEKVTDLYPLGSHGGLREGAGRKVSASGLD